MTHPYLQNHTNFKDLEYLYAARGTILDDALWFQVGQVVHNDPAYYDTSWTRHVRSWPLSLLGAAMWRLGNFRGGKPCTLISEGAFAKAVTN